MNSETPSQAKLYSLTWYNNVTSGEGKWGAMPETASGVSANIRFSPRGEAPDIPCFRCGLCCLKYRVQVDLTEAERIACGLGLSLDRFLEDYAEAWFDNHFIRQRGDACIFLKYENSRKTRCLIHHTKPQACREWTPNRYRRECREGLARYWELSVSPSGELQGVEDKLKDFHDFIGSLATED